MSQPVGSAALAFPPAQVFRGNPLTSACLFPDTQRSKCVGQNAAGPSD